MGVTQQIASDPSEVTIVTDNRQLAMQIVRLSFDFARAEADAITSNQRSTPVQAQTGGTPEQQAMVKAENQIDQDIKNAESQLNSLKQKLATATGRQRSLLESQIAQTQSELELQKTRKDAIHNMREFVAGAGGEAGEERHDGDHHGQGVAGNGGRRHDLRGSHTCEVHEEDGKRQ